MRTTSLQVSGYKFLLRRLELALVIGDPRMAHDPLKSQRRAIIVGLLLSALIAGGGVMLALLKPEPSLSGHALVSDEQGSLHVRLEDGFHQVSNVASARLVLQQPADVHKTTAKQIQEQPLGEPMGIGHVPSLAAAPIKKWLVCDVPHKPHLQVQAVDKTTEHPRAIVRSGQQTWLVQGTKRSLANTDAARALGATAISMSPQLLARFDEQAPSQLPNGPSGLSAPFDQAGVIVHAGARSFLVGNGGIAEVTGAQRDYAEALTTSPSQFADLAEIMALPTKELLPNLPKQDTKWDAPQQVCLSNDGLAEPAPDAQLRAEHSPHYAGPKATSALLTEHGFVLVDSSGTRFGIGKAQDIRALGFENHAYVPWRIISGLPDGGILSEENARATRPTMSTTASNAANVNGTR